MRSLSARIARADAVRRFAGAVAPFAGAVALLGAGAWAARSIERTREVLAAAAIGYCTEAATLDPAGVLEGLREGMLSGDDAAGVVYKAAVAGFRAQCAAEVANRGAR